MPTPHLQRIGSPATHAQQRYLRSLTASTGSTFSLPRDKADASRQIADLMSRSRDRRSDIAREQRHVQDDLARRPSDATRHRADEVTGYGSSARWARGEQEPER